jgi:hypothetical protein
LTLVLRAPEASDSDDREVPQSGSSDAHP